jgi:acetyltransferase-like isoleucine patch superfamily enzyme
LGVKRLVKRLFYGPKAESRTYIEYLRTKGMKIGENVTIYAPTKTTIDEQYPWMIEIGDHVKIAQGEHLVDT